MQHIGNHYNLSGFDTPLAFRYFATGNRLYFQSRSNYEKTYVSHILSDGTQGFVTSGDEEGLRLNWNEGWRDFKPALVYDPVAEALYAAFEEHSSSQGSRNTVLQKVSKEGKLLWSNPAGEEGNTGGLLLNNVSGSGSLQLAGEGKLAFFHGYSVSLFDVGGEQPQYVWPDKQFTYTMEGSKAGLLALPLFNNDHFLTFWYDYRTGNTAQEVRAAYAQKIPLPAIRSSPSSLDFGEARRLDRIKLSWTQDVSTRLRSVDMTGNQDKLKQKGIIWRLFRRVIPLNISPRAPSCRPKLAQQAKLLQMAIVKS